MVSGLAATAVTVIAADEISKTVKSYQDENNSVYYSKKQEIEDASNDIPNKLKKSDDVYFVDKSKFSQKVKSNENVIYRDDGL